MAKVKLVMTSTLAMYLNSERELQLEATNVRDLLQKLSERFGDAFRQRVLDDKGNLKSFVVLYINGKNIEFTEGVDTKLEDGDEVLILPAIGGGNPSIF
ncbi:MAG: MoaD family protein [Nitrososphaerota archaeon]|nr:MoaD family protein [Aigarchaeota archaeon]MDW8076708.1 MoaD family protein [Nitrososphaerota archaeon]